MIAEKDHRHQWDEEEWDPDAPYIGGYTMDQLDALPQRQRDREFQKVTQVFATYLGYYKTCTLPVCRRAKACRGFLTEAQYALGGYHSACPPCAGHGAPRHGELVDCIHQIAEAQARQSDMQTQVRAPQASQRRKHKKHQ
ncbi:MAG: hypothetical protein ACOH2J_14405 [Allorhizobium sp.]